MEAGSNLESVTHVSQSNQPAELIFRSLPAPRSAAEAAQRVVKRAMDLTTALLLLLALLPVLVVVALLVKLSTPGPIVYSQERVGRGGRIFRLYKFRTMFRDSDPAAHEAYCRAFIEGTAEQVDGTFKLRHDPRVTPVGRYLRRYSLDEFPQLFNVLKGDMSLVGPRPPIMYEAQLYNARELLRLAVTPGLTGLWQVSGRNALSFEQMIELDLAYIRRWSLRLDLAILLRTPLVVLTGRGAA